MVGALTVMVVILAVFLAYNANSGLPFVPSYRVSAELPDAAQLVPGNEVRIGGVRVGQIEDVVPQANGDGNFSARLDLKLNAEVDPLPVDSTLMVRARSALGLKYLEITRGTSDEGYAAGSLIPESAAVPEPVEIDQVLSTFNAKTRAAMQENLVEFGNALAGRGPQLNAALGRLPAVLRYLEPVMRNLSSDSTGLARFIRGSAAAAAEVAPVAATQAEMFVNLDTTFTALASVARPFIQETISETPPTFAVAEETLPVIRPFLDHSATLFAALEPGVQEITATAPTIADTLENGTPVLAASPRFNAQLAPTAQSLRQFNDDTDVRNGLGRLLQTTNILGPTMRFVAPAQTVCNYATLLFRNAASLFSKGSGGGRWQRFTVFQPPAGPNNEGQVASGPANGGGEPGNYLHINPYPNTASPGQTFECEAGNEVYKVGQQVIGNVPGNQGIETDLQLPSQLGQSGEPATEEQP
jgi:virulence factor Mce-like protein